MSSCNHTSNDDDDDLDELVESLEDNLGRVITVFTTSGGCSGRGFTGLLVKVDETQIKLVTSLPSAPRHPFCFNEFDPDNFSRRRDRCCCSRFGTSIIIPINRIASFAFNDQ